MKNIVILGSTGSVGRNTLEVIRNLDADYKVLGLAANKQWDLIAQQIDEFRPKWIAMANDDGYRSLESKIRSGLRRDVKLLKGPKGLTELVSFEEVDMVVSAIMGSAGLPATIETIKNKKTLAIANKETLVMAGEIVMPLAERHGVTILPVDSEHSAIFQSLRAGNKSEIKRLILTASGGPFYDYPKEKLSEVSASQALKHPTWNMGKKITIDSATLMNKALEIIEARWLFDIDVSRIEVVIHPQSIIHSMVEFCDGSVIAQIGMPDMKVPIQFALTYPERKPINNVESLDLARLGSLTFKPSDNEKFPALELGYEAARIGGTMGTALNAANEVAVQAFLDNQIRFTDIVKIVKIIMEKHLTINKPSLEEVMEADRWAREEVNKCLS